MLTMYVVAGAALLTTVRKGGGVRRTQHGRDAREGPQTIRAGSRCVRFAGRREEEWEGAVRAALAEEWGQGAEKHTLRGVDWGRWRNTHSASTSRWVEASS